MDIPLLDCSNSAYVCTRDQLDCKLLAKEVLIEDDDIVIECKLSTEIKLTFILLNKLPTVFLFYVSI